MKILLFLASTIVIITSGLFYSLERPQKIEKQKGVCWVGQSQPVTAADFIKLKEAGVTWISQTPFGWQQSIHDTTIRFEKNTNRTPWWGESFVGIAATTQMAKKIGIKTILKPHLWLRQSWPGEVEMKSEAEWKVWFKNYEIFVLAYAYLADSSGIDILCIGTELQKTIHRPEWKSIIKKVKQVYKGKLTYAANFNEFEQVTFWNDLDYIGIQAYFPLSKDSLPTSRELREGWQLPIAKIEALLKKSNKPVLFTEIGYKSTNNATMQPWLWPDYAITDNASNKTQALAYEIFFKEVWSKPWMAGVYFWKWYPQIPKRSVAVDFTPQGKPAEQIMTTWFKKQ
jgi:hypothetical protein